MHTKLPIISFLQKLIIFLLPDFRRIRKEVSKSEILWPIAWTIGIKRFIWFSKIMPLGASRSFVQMFSKWKESVYRDGFITNSNHQFFPDPKSNFWKTFSFFFQWLYDHEIYSFLETSARFLMTKAYKISLFISCKCWHQNNVYISRKSTFTDDNIHNQKTNKNCPLVDPLS